MKDVMGIFYQVQKAYQRYCYDAVAPMGIKMSEMACILFLYNNERQDTAHAIAEHYQLSPSMISKSLKVLKKTGYVEDRRDDADSRLVHLRLTEKAAPIVEKLSQVQTHFIQEVAEGISGTEFRGLVALAERMQKNLFSKPALAGGQKASSSRYGAVRSDWQGETI